MDALAIISGVAALISAAAAIVSLFAARNANKTQKKIHLFDKRKHVFDKLMAFLAQPQVTGRPHEHEELNQYLSDTKDEEHLGFRPQVSKFLSEVHQKAHKFRTHHTIWEAMPGGPERQEKYKAVQSSQEELDECLVKAKTIFKDDLDLS